MAGVGTTQPTPRPIPMPASARSLLALVQRVQEGSVPAQHLQHALEGAAARIGKTILPAPRSATELQSLRDPAFEHLGHKLEELGRALVEKLSEELDTSELLCWELLLHENELATEAAPAPTELVRRDLTLFPYPYPYRYRYPYHYPLPLPLPLTPTPHPNPN